MKNLYIFFYLDCEFKAELQGDCSPPLQRNKQFYVNTAWLCADFDMRCCQNSYSTATAAAHTATKTWRGKGKGHAVSLLNCLLRTRRTRSTKQVLVLPFTQHSGTCQDKVGQLQPPSAQGCQLGAQHPVKGKTNLPGETALLQQGELRRINQSFVEQSKIYPSCIMNY